MTNTDRAELVEQLRFAYAAGRLKSVLPPRAKTNRVPRTLLKELFPELYTS